MVAMATPLKRKSPATGKPPAGRPSRTSAALSRPFLRFYYAEGLHKKTLSVLDRLETAQDATAHRDALADVVVELTNSGLDFYFMKPLKDAKAGFVLEQMASLGMKGVQQVLASVIRQIIGRMDSPQLLSVCSSIRQMMR
jgi:hypothetical protein